MSYDVVAKQQVDDELQWFFHSLWKKTSPRAPAFSFKIADTIAMNGKKPHAWYFSCENKGHILIKSNHLCTVPTIAKEFSEMQHDKMVPAVQSYIQKAQRHRETGVERATLCIGHLTNDKVLPYLSSQFQEGLPSLIQRVPQQSFGEKNHTITVTLCDNGHDIQVTKTTNINAITNASLPLQQRSITVEATSKSKKKQVETELVPKSSLLYGKLAKAIEEIKRQIQASSSVTVKQGTFYFKDCGDIEKVVLLFATSLQTEPKVPVLQQKTKGNLVICSQDLLVNRTTTTQQNNGVPQLDNLPAAFQASQVDGIFIPRGSFDPTRSTERKRQVSRSLSHDFAEARKIKSDSNEKEHDYDDVALRDNTFMETGSVSRLMAQSTRQAIIIRYLRKLEQKNNKCANCQQHLQKNEEDEIRTVNASILIRVHNFFMQSPASLLLIPPTSFHQQRFIETMYQDMLEQGPEREIPLLLKRAFNLTSMDDFQLMQKESMFLYKDIVICNNCQQMLAKILTHQSDEQIKAYSHQYAQSHRTNNRSSRTVNSVTSQSLKQSLLKQELKGQLVELSSSQSKTNKGQGIGGMSLEQQTIYQHQIDALKGRILAKSFKAKQDNKLDNKLDHKLGRLTKRSPKVAQSETQAMRTYQVPKTKSAVQALSKKGMSAKLRKQIRKDGNVIKTRIQAWDEQPVNLQTPKKQKRDTFLSLRQQNPVFTLKQQGPLDLVVIKGDQNLNRGGFRQSSNFSKSAKVVNAKRPRPFSAKILPEKSAQFVFGQKHQSSTIYCQESSGWVDKRRNISSGFSKDNPKKANKVQQGLAQFKGHASYAGKNRWTPSIEYAMNNQHDYYGTQKYIERQSVAGSQNYTPCEQVEVQSANLPYKQISENADFVIKSKHHLHLVNKLVSLNHATMKDSDLIAANADGMIQILESIKSASAKKSNNLNEDQSTGEKLKPQAKTIDDVDQQKSVSSSKSIMSSRDDWVDMAQQVRIDTPADAKKLDTSNEISQNKEADSPENCVLEEYSQIDAIDPKIELDHAGMNVGKSQPVLSSDFDADKNNNRGDKGRPIQQDDKTGEDYSDLKRLSSHNALDDQLSEIEQRDETKMTNIDAVLFGDDGQAIGTDTVASGKETATEVRVDEKESGDIQSATNEEETAFGRTKTVIARNNQTASEDGKTDGEETTFGRTKTVIVGKQTASEVQSEQYPEEDQNGRDSINDAFSRMETFIVKKKIDTEQIKIDAKIGEILVKADEEEIAIGRAKTVMDVSKVEQALTEQSQSIDQTDKTVSVALNDSDSEGQMIQQESSNVDDLTQQIEVGQIAEPLVENKIDELPEQIELELIVAPPVVLKDEQDDQDNQDVKEEVNVLNNQSDHQEEPQISEKSSSKTLIEDKRSDKKPNIEGKQVQSYSIDYEREVDCSVFDFLNEVYATSIEMSQHYHQVELAEKEQKIAIFIKMFLDPIYDTAIELSQPKVVEQAKLQPQFTFIESDDQEIIHCLSQDQQSWEDVQPPKSQSSVGVLEQNDIDLLGKSYSQQVQIIDMQQDETFDDVEKQLEQLQHLETFDIPLSENESEMEKSAKIKYTHTIKADGGRRIMAEVVRIVKKTENTTNADDGAQKEQLMEQFKSRNETGLGKDEKEKQASETGQKEQVQEGEQKVDELKEEQPESVPGNIPTAGLKKMWKRNEEAKI